MINAGNVGTPSGPPNQATDCYSGPNFFPRFTIQIQPLGPSSCLVGFNPGTNIKAEFTGLVPFLGYYGGQTPTLALTPSSLAIGAGGTAPPDECPGIDQNGYGRPAGQCDIGAVQFRELHKLQFAKILPKKKLIKRKRTRVFTVAVRNQGILKLTQVRVCIKLPGGAKKALKLKGEACKTVGALEKGKPKQAKFRLMAKPKAKKKSYTVKATVRGNGASLKTRNFKVRVK